MGCRLSLRERFEISPPMRIHPFRARLVVYRIEEDGDVLIVRVRHGREDWAGDPPSLDRAGMILKLRPACL
ncbi:type II toxin-antitoxin system RelE/ParE family toxin [Mesorhizobium plurifarium]|nr:type II toxin-antitoxin system RelE/ParE family toxin [Mesorhizobium plurifarium]